MPSERRQKVDRLPVTSQVQATSVPLVREGHVYHPTSIPGIYVHRLPQTQWITEALAQSSIDNRTELDALGDKLALVRIQDGIPQSGEYEYLPPDLGCCDPALVAQLQAAQAPSAAAVVYAAAARKRHEGKPRQGRATGAPHHDVRPVPNKRQRLQPRE